MTGLSIRKKNIVFMLLAGLIALSAYVDVLVVCGITPLGDETFLMYDMKRQYIDYYAYVRTLLSGENNLLYSFATALGSGMLGFEVYYLSSPFMIVFGMCPPEALPTAVSAVIGIKLTIAAMIMYAFLRRESKDDGDVIGFLITDIIAASWAMSSFLFAHSMNMMWIDVVILLPLMIWSLEYMLKGYTERKSGQFWRGMIPYTLCMAAILILNYYISFQVIIILGLWTLMYMWIKGDRHPLLQIARIVTASVVAAGMDAVLLIPTALELANSPKDISKLGLELTGKNLFIRDVLSKLPACSYDYIEARFGLPQVYCGVVLIFLSVLYFMCAQRSIRERVARAIYIGVLLVSFCHDSLNLIWHAGMEPSGHPYRYAYMWIFLMIICSYDVTMEFYNRREEDENKSKIIISGLGRLVIAMVIIGIVFYEVLRLRYDHISQQTIYLNWALFAGFSVLLAAIIICRAFNKSRLVIAIMALISVVQMGELVMSDGYTFIYQSMNNQNMSEYSHIRSTTSEAVEAVKGCDNSFYRMENLNPRQQNDAMQYNYNGITHYSSAGMIYVRYFLQRMGFNDDELYTHYGHDNTATADSILGVKYVLSDGTYEVHDHYERLYEGEVCAYSNPYVLPVAITTEGFNYEDISDGTDIADSNMIHVPAVDPFALQEDIYSRLLGREVRLFEHADVSRLPGESDKPCDIYNVTATTDGEMYMYIDGILEYEQGLSLYIDDEFVTTYGNAACCKVINLGYRGTGDSVTIKLEADTEDAHMGEGVFVTELTDELMKASEEVSRRGAVISRLSSSHLSIECGTGDGLFLTIPCEKGWSITVDGTRVMPVAIYDSLTYIPISDGSDSHVIDMRFVPEGMIVGMIISIMAILVFGIIVFVTMRSNAESCGRENNEQK